MKLYPLWIAQQDTIKFKWHQKIRKSHLSAHLRASSATKVMPFGLKNSRAIYQRAMQTIFEDMLHKTVECYIDDLVVKSRKRQDHLRDL